MYHRVMASPSRLRGMGDVASDVTNFPFGKYSAQTLVIQNQLNEKLIQNGFCPIIADGKLGPATCGAALVIGGLQPGEMILAPSTCSDFKQPNDASTGCGTGPSAPAQPPSASPTGPSSAAPASQSAGSSGHALAIGVGVGILALGAGYLAWSRTH